MTRHWYFADQLLGGGSALVNGSGYVFAYRILVTGLKNYIGVSGSVVK